MIMKIISVVYAWIWNVQPWQPTSKADFMMIIGVSSILDPIAIAGLALAVIKTISHISKGRPK